MIILSTRSIKFRIQFYTLLLMYTIQLDVYSKCALLFTPINQDNRAGCLGLRAAGELVRQDAVACLGRSRPDRTVLCATGVLRDAAARLFVFFLLYTI
eukprot:SAG22_NODE_965_length_6268_cov_30.435403_7_plen_98_part_00